MDFETFSKICDSYENSLEKTRKLNKLGVDLYDFTDSFYTIIHDLIKEIYGKEGEDWFSWFCSENEFGKKDWDKDKDIYEQTKEGKIKKAEKKSDGYGAHDEKGNPIFHTKKSAWKILEKEHSRINKKS
jgi:hypothetical protein